MSRTPAETGLLQSTLDSLPAHAALLDGKSVVIAANDHRRYLPIDRPLPIPPARLGVNFLNECKTAIARGSDEAQRAARGVQSLLSTASAAFDFEYSLGGRSPRFLRVRGHRSGDNGESRIMIWHEDVTESKRTLAALNDSEEQLRQAQHAATLGKLVVGAAHNFNNMLTALLGYTDVLALRLDSDASSLAQLAKIRKTTLKAASVAQQLLDFGRKGAGRSELLDLNAVVIDLREMIEIVCGKKVNVQVVAAAQPCLVRADAGQIEQIVVNLALNARDAMPAGGTLLIETARRTAAPPNASTPRDCCVISVIDSGTGIDPAVRSRLFEPFFTTKSAGKGSGLGLYSVDRIVRRFGGFITVESAVNRGTRFEVHLPAARSARTDA